MLGLFCNDIMHSACRPPDNDVCATALQADAHGMQLQAASALALVLQHKDGISAALRAGAAPAMLEAVQGSNAAVRNAVTSACATGCCHQSLRAALVDTQDRSGQPAVISILEVIRVAASRCKRRGSATAPATGDDRDAVFVSSGLELLSKIAQVHSSPPIDSSHAAEPGHQCHWSSLVMALPESQHACQCVPGRAPMATRTA